MAWEPSGLSEARVTAEPERGRSVFVDWCVDVEVLGAALTAEAEICAHLARHVLDPVLVGLARPVVASLLRDPPGPRIWLNLDWEDQAPRLEARLVPAAVSALPGTLVAPGVTVAHLDASRLWAEAGDSAAVSVELGLVRAPEADLDPNPADPGRLPEGFPAAVGAHIAEDVAGGWSLEAAAARAGATLAEQVASRRAVLGDLAAVVGVFVDAERALGGHFDQVLVRGTRAVLGCRRCPFGTSPDPQLCRFTSALAGGLGARLGGSAEVVLDERIAMGDPQCRLVLDVASSTPRLTAHHYRWPPAGVPEPAKTEDGSATTRGFRITLSLLLPRDRFSVPVARHLTRAALMEVGVVADDADEVELALSEACGNVVAHSGTGDRYEVAVTLGPVNAELRVVDQGRGFDHATLGQKMAGTDAERGRGLALMHALVDHVGLQSSPEVGTVVHLVKRLRFDDSVPARRIMLDLMASGEDSET